MSDGNPQGSTQAPQQAASNSGGIGVAELANAIVMGIRQSGMANGNQTQQTATPKVSHYDKLLADFRANSDRYSDPLEWDRLKTEAMSADIEEKQDAKRRQEIMQDRVGRDQQLVYSLADKVLKQYPELHDEREDIVQGVIRRFMNDSEHALANERYKQNGHIDLGYMENMIQTRAEKLAGKTKKATGASGVTQQDAMSEQGALSREGGSGHISRSSLSGKELDQWDAAVGIFQRTGATKDDPKTIDFATKKIELFRASKNKEKATR